MSMRLTTPDNYFDRFSMPIRLVLGLVVLCLSCSCNTSTDCYNFSDGQDSVEICLPSDWSVTEHNETRLSFVLPLQPPRGEANLHLETIPLIDRAEIAADIDAQLAAQVAAGFRSGGNEYSVTIVETNSIDADNANISYALAQYSQLPAGHTLYYVGAFVCGVSDCFSFVGGGNRLAIMDALDAMAHGTKFR